MSRPAGQTVFVVDDDRDVRDSLTWLFESVGMQTRAFESAESFLDRYGSDSPGCIVLDVRMPGMGGLGLLDRLAGSGIPTPVVIITGHGDVPMAVRAMRLGAVDFIQKPLDHQELLERVRQALRTDMELREAFGDYQSLSSRWRRLTPREEEVLARLVDGQANKVIAADLGISTRTVETHRARLMGKLEVRSFATLVRVALLYRRGGS
ncbi:MAG: response regulator [Chromatiales bacterium]